jgi:hypothetical protein
MFIHATLLNISSLSDDMKDSGNRASFGNLAFIVTDRGCVSRDRDILAITSVASE